MDGSRLQVDIKLRRMISYHLTNTYLPTITLLIIAEVSKTNKTSDNKDKSDKLEQLDKHLSQTNNTSQANKPSIDHDPIYIIYKHPSLNYVWLSQAL